MKSIVQYLNESWVISDDDYYYHFDDWVKDKNKILFIVGLSGSGKTTLGKQLVDKYNGTYISIDDIWMPILRKYKKDNMVEIRDVSEEVFEDIDNQVINKLKTILKTNTKNKVVVEGVHILKLDYDYLKNQSIIIKGSSYFKSFYQALKRDGEKYSKKGVSRFVNHYWHYLGMIKTMEHQIIALKNHLK